MLINNLRFAKNHEEASSELNIKTFDRLQEFMDCDGVIGFKITGAVTKKDLSVLNINIYGKISTLCQSCFEVIDVDISLATDIIIVNSEEEADNLMFLVEDSVDYAIVKNDKCDVLSLVEDELITNLSMSPEHNSCQSMSFKDSLSNPFDALKNNFNKDN